MCGIMGYVGPRPASPIILQGLKRLEYRGYDSAGVAVANDGKIEVRKAAGKLDRLADMLETSAPDGTLGIGHTRWATHGPPTDVNAHPHADTEQAFAIVHNGIIENYFELKAELVAAAGSSSPRPTPRCSSTSSPTNTTATSPRRSGGRSVAPPGPTRSWR